MRDVQVGVAVIVSTAVLIYGVWWFRGAKLRKDTNAFHVTFHETSGLVVGDPVQVSGVVKGQVTGIRLAPPGVEVTLAIDRDVPIRSDASVSVRNLGMMGEKFVAVDPGRAGAPLASGARLSGGYESGLPEMLANSGPLIANLSRLIHSLDRTAKVLEEGDNFRVTVENLRGASEDIRSLTAGERANLRETVENFHAASADLRRLLGEEGPNLGTTLANLNRASARLDSLVVELSAASASARAVFGALESGEGTAGRLLHDPSLYDQIRKTVDSLDALIADIKANPKKYIHLEIF
jgi:phospholipid/cholesterol/gamma-HCH transport system substrate-binding protein